MRFWWKPRTWLKRGKTRVIKSWLCLYTASDWLRGRSEFFWPITGLSNAKPSQSIRYVVEKSPNRTSLRRVLGVIARHSDYGYSFHWFYLCRIQKETGEGEDIYGGTTDDEKGTGGKDGLQRNTSNPFFFHQNIKFMASINTRSQQIQNQN